jgi:heat shock protein HslJ
MVVDDGVMMKLTTCVAASVLATIVSAGVLPASASADPASDSLARITATGDVVPENEPLVNTYWVIRYVVEDGKNLPVPKLPEAYVAFLSTGEMQAFDGCNSLHGDFTVVDSMITLGGVASTKKACQIPDPAFERKIISVLSKGELRYVIGGKRLQLIRADSGPGLIAQAQPWAW